MTRFEAMGRIVEQLHELGDDSLKSLLANLSDDITDETLDAVTYGKNDTEHLQSSSVNAEDLDKAVTELEGCELLSPQHAA